MWVGDWSFKSCPWPRKLILTPHAQAEGDAVNLGKSRLGSGSAWFSSDLRRRGGGSWLWVAQRRL